MHLELAHSLDTETFLHPFRRFAACSGLILSDNAKTFKSACKEIRKVCRSTIVKKVLMKKGAELRFIREKSPWFGSLYNRMVGTVKVMSEKNNLRSNAMF